MFRVILRCLSGVVFAVVVGAGGCSSSEGSGGTPRSGDPCASVGCGVTPYCDEGCQSQCGCCTCADGSSWSSPRGEAVCRSGCWQLVADAAADSSLDPCANVGCAAPPFCDTGCTATCGCCACGEGERVSADGGAFVCQGGCYAPLDGGNEAGAASDAASGG